MRHLVYVTVENFDVDGNPNTRRKRVHSRINISVDIPDKDPKKKPTGVSFEIDVVPGSVEILCKGQKLLSTTPEELWKGTRFLTEDEACDQPHPDEESVREGMAEKAQDRHDGEG